MKTITLCIIDPDRAYTSALTEGIAAAHRGFRILAPAVAETSPFDSSEEGKEGQPARFMEECDVILVDAALLRDWSGDAGRSRPQPGHWDKIVVLTDGMRACAPTLRAHDEGNARKDAPGGVAACQRADGCAANPVSVDKYGGCAAIIAAVRLKYALIAGQILPETGKFHTETEILSFFGMEGGAGTSSVALGIARELSAYRDKAVIYLSREPFESSRLCLQGRVGQGDVTDYLYFFLKGERDKLIGLRDALMIADDYGVRRFYPANGPNTLRELNDAELTDFIAELLRGGEVDFLILDLGTGFGDTAIDKLPLPGSCVMVTNHRGVKSKDCAEWRRSVREALGIAADRFAVAVNFVDESEDCAMEPEDCAVEPENCAAEPEEPYVVRIGRDASDFRDTGYGIEIDLTNEFGRGVKRLADRLTGCDAFMWDERGSRHGIAARGNGSEGTDHAFQS
ncbi:MAG: hypothetical protein LBO81_07325 [Clostridiales Family XIII bacterium]|jgi:hypothetical protein|nr:hypothetical protein [Clostridiales Family XIII bacterium]